MTDRFDRCRPVAAAAVNIRFATSKKPAARSLLPAAKSSLPAAKPVPFFAVAPVSQ